MTSPAPDLGKLRSVHPDRGNLVRSAVVVVLAGPGAAGAIYLGVPTHIAELTALVVAVAAVVLWAVGKRGARIELHEHGLLARTGDSLRALAWSDVRSVASSSKRRRDAGVELERHIVVGKDGTTVEFSLRHARSAQLLAAIHDATHERLRTEALRAYDAGEVLDFGPLAVSEAGFRDGGGAIIPWTQLDRATIDMPVFAVGETWSQVKVWKKGATAPLASYASDRVPNAKVLLDVVALAVDATNERD
jgi:hypothetical protein